MVIKKEELIGHLTEKQRKVVERLQRKIDKKIKNHYVEGNSMRVHSSGFLHGNVREELKKIYKEAGWHLYFEGGFILWDREFNLDMVISLARS